MTNGFGDKDTSNMQSPSSAKVLSRAVLSLFFMFSMFSSPKSSSMETSISIDALELISYTRFKALPPFRTNMSISVSSENNEITANLRIFSNCATFIRWVPPYLLQYKTNYEDYTINGYGMPNQGGLPKRYR